MERSYINVRIIKGHGAFKANYIHFLLTQRFPDQHQDHKQRFYWHASSLNGLFNFALSTNSLMNEKEMHLISV